MISFEIKPQRPRQFSILFLSSVGRGSRKMGVGIRLRGGGCCFRVRASSASARVVDELETLVPVV